MKHKPVDPKRRWHKPNTGDAPPTRTYMVVDVEVFDTDWASIGILVASYPQGNILDTLEIGCADGTQINPDKQNFWNEHGAAFAYNRDLGTGTDRMEQEEHLCAFLEKWFQKEPGLYLVSDNPMFDIGFLQDLFVRHRKTQSVMVRDGRYYPSICTWSMRRATQLMTGTTFNHIQSCTRDVSVWSCDPRRLQHTPLADCGTTIAEFFLLLDFIFHFRYSWRKNHARYRY